MRDKRLRGKIANEAARLLFQQEETEYVRAKRKAARTLGLRFKPNDLPSNREIREYLARITEAVDVDPLSPPRRQVELEGLRWLRRLSEFQPQFIWPPPAAGAADLDFEIIVFADKIDDVLAVLREHRVDYQIQPARSVPGGGGATCLPIRLSAPIPGRLIVAPAALAAGPLLSLATGEPACTRNREELEEELRRLDPNADLDAELLGLHPASDRFDLLQLFLEQLEEVQPIDQTAGDGLHHSLQVFDAAVLERPYDEEFLTAALLHDVGALCDRRHPIAESLSLLEGLVTHRSLWLIAHLDAESPIRPQDASTADWADLKMLRELEAAGGVPGLHTRGLDEAIHYLRSLDGGLLWEDGLDAAPRDAD